MHATASCFTDSWSRARLSTRSRLSTNFRDLTDWRRPRWFQFRQRGQGCDPANQGEKKDEQQTGDENSEVRLVSSRRMTHEENRVGNEHKDDQAERKRED